MNNETVITDNTTKTSVEEKPIDNLSPTIEMGDKNLQPKTAPKWGNWKQSFINGIDKIYGTLDPGFKAENKNQQETTSINKNLQKQNFNKMIMN